MLGKTFRVPGACESCTPLGMSLPPSSLIYLRQEAVVYVHFFMAEVNKCCLNIENTPTFFPNTQLLVKLLSFFFLVCVSLMANYCPKWLHISMLDRPPSWALFHLMEKLPTRTKH